MTIVTWFLASTCLNVAVLVSWILRGRSQR